METFFRIIRLGHTNFWRNRWLTLGATLLMTLTLTMISVSLIISFIIRDTANTVRSSINLSIYFHDADEIPQEKIDALADRIRGLPNVVSVEFISKEKALAIFQRLPLNQTIKDPVNSQFNPLPRSLEVETEDLEQLAGTVEAIDSADHEEIVCGECLSYTKNKEIVDRLISSTRTAQQAGWLLSIFFGLIAIFNVYNIIRLTINARADEIEIMRYVGASNAFIRGPFVVEGVLYGLLGTAATTLLVPTLAGIISQYQGSSGLTTLGSAAGVLNTNFFNYVIDHLGSLVLIQLAIGVILGVLVSILSIRRYLRV